MDGRYAHRPQRHCRIGIEENAQCLGLTISPDQKQRPVVVSRGVTALFSFGYFVEFAVVAGAPVHACPDVVYSFVVDHFLVNVTPQDLLRQPRLNPGRSGYRTRIACRDQAR